MTGFIAPPSTTDSTTPLSKCVPGQDFYHTQMEYTRARVVIRFFRLNGTRIIPVLVPLAFKDVKQNYSVYILNKQDITITDGKVISVGFPHLDLSTKPAMGQSQMVVDVTIEANSKTATYSIPENLSVTYAGDVVLSTDKQGLMAEVEQMKNTAEKILESVPKQKEVVDKTTVLLSELNPVYKEKKETEQRFSKIEESISRMESTVNNFINSFNHAQGNSNTAQ